MHIFYFFFFQAEDGIRDGTVTGVQTCALPISAPRRCGVLQPAEPVGRAPRFSGPPRAGRGAVGGGTLVLVAARGPGNEQRDPVRLGAAARSAGDLRSEERRVGKECRTLWRA